LHLGERFLGARRAGHLVAGLGEHVGEALAARGRVVHYENRLDRHGVTFTLARGGSWIVFCTAWIRPSFVSGLGRAPAEPAPRPPWIRPSFVIGLVRQRAEPASRPRARSNTPSFEDSMITGVDLSFGCCLMRAQVW